jgi:hypothetical protein
VKVSWEKVFRLWAELKKVPEPDKKTIQEGELKNGK